ncbi:MAG: transposase [Pyrinomonadaceae bacterium]|nr:transposase [Pyrinomonadaceae bacterium]
MKVSCSAYCAYASGKSHVSSPEKASVAEQVKAEFYQHRRRYGSRRLAAELKDQGLAIGRFQVRAVMRRENLHAICARRFVPQTTDSRHHYPASPNLLREIENVPQRLGEVLVGDITYLPLQSGK